jgi:lipopolysaccharide transport system permease protein
MAQSRSLMSMSESTGHFLDTLRALVSRDFRMRYKGSALGILWALLSPLGTVVVLQFLFGRVLNVGPPHFAVFLYSGILPWTWFQASVQSGSTTLAENRDLVRTPFFSKPLLPWTVTCTNFVLYLFSLPVLLGLMIYDGLPITTALVLLPAVWLAQFLLTIALAVLMAAIGILIRDWQHLIAAILMLWFYLTPIFYDVDNVPADLRRWFQLNPLTPLVTAHRAILIEGHAPEWTPLALVGAFGAVLLGLSLTLFRSLEDSFIDKA